ncbi:MAG TPA: alpha-L-rhamnosidase, partial [Candidatus Hydrogenedentes bacterium]|nr:alpha-L-rhamnosidase [Candidatus Hydrogenedentota bacterium]
ALGSVGEWLFRVVAGLYPYDGAEPGWEPAYKHFVVRPRPGGGITWAKAAYHSIRGPIHVAWRTEQAKFVLALTVPPNTTARVHLPVASPESVTESGQPLSEVPFITLRGVADSHVLVDVASGTYSFACEVTEA